MTATELQEFVIGDVGQMALDCAVARSDARDPMLRPRVAEPDLRPGGTVSGPLMFGLADVAMDLALISRAS